MLITFEIRYLAQGLFLPPANDVCEGYVFTGVCLSMGGVCPIAWGVHPPPRQNLLRAGNPSRQTTPRQTPPWADTPPCAVHAERYGQQAGGTHPTGMHSF